MSKLNGGIIGPDNVPTGAFGSASGVWSLSDVTNYKKQGTWPVVLTGHQVANSCRFNSGSSDYLNRTFSTGNRRTFTYSGWCKRPPEEETAFLTVGSGTTRSYIFITSSKLTVQNEVSSSVTTNLQTNAVYRDSSAWMHIVVAVDTTQGTEANRIKIYVNGEQITSFGTSNYPSQNEDFSFNNNIVHEIGRTPWNNGNLYDGYFCEIVWIDGLQLTPTSFGETDSVTNNWVPKDVSGLTFGTNGFYLDFKDSSALGNDVSGNNNDWTVNNLTSIDQSIDTCTNNFATLNPLATNTNTGSSNFSEGSLELDRPGSTSSWVGCINTMGVTQGKWYAEYKVIDAGDPQNGVMIGVTNVDLSNFQNAGNDLSQSGEFGINYYAGGTIANNGSNIATYTAMSDGDIVMIALDIDNGKIYWGRNGTWENSGVPTSGSTGTGAQNLSVITTGDTYCFHLCCREDGNVQANYGSPPYAISSGNVDSSGMGNFEYAVPEGYYSLCTRNLNLIG